MHFESSIELANMSPRGREVFRGIVTAVDDNNINFDVLGQGLVWLNNLPSDEIFTILSEAQRHGGWMAQAYAALTVCLVAQTFTLKSQRQRDILVESEQVIAQLLAQPHNDEALFVFCNMMGVIKVVPSFTLPTLLSFLDHKNWLVVAGGAVALCSVPDKVPQALPVLHRLLRSDNDRAKLIAATVMAINNYQLDLAISALSEVLPRSGWEDRCSVVRLIENIGPRARRLLPILEQMLADETLPSFFRARAATAIGSVTKGSSSHLNLLSETLLSTDWQIMDGAADGLQVHGGFRNSDIDRITAHLESESREMRKIAAISLKRFGPSASRAVTKLIERFRKEQDPHLCLGLTETVAAIGVAAVAPLIEAAKENDFRIVPLIAKTLYEIGEHAALPVVEQLVRDREEHIRLLGIVLVRDLRSKAAPAIPTLVEMLDETWDLELAQIIAAILSFCGRDSEMAAGCLVRTLIRCDDSEFISVASHALRQIGSPAVVELSKASAVLSGKEKIRIDNALATCQPQLSEQFKRLQELNSDELLRYFVLAAQLLTNQNRVGWGEIGKRIAPTIDFKRPNGVPFGTSANAVRDNFKELAKRLKVGPLTTHRAMVHGTLSGEGELLMNEASEYLCQKYGAASAFAEKS